MLELESTIDVGVSASLCADDDAAAMAIAGVDCPTASEYGYCDSYLCPDCAYAGVCDAACGYCSTCADDDAAAMAIAGVDCPTASEYEYCDPYLCPDCVYAGVCDAACGYCSTTASTTIIPITNVTHRCWETFTRYRLVWTPEENSNEPAVIGFKAWDGIEYSSEATIKITILPVDGVPVAGEARYAVNEDTDLSSITLHAVDVDSDFVSILITQVPEHGTLYMVENISDGLVWGDAILQAYSQWDVVEPIEQYASTVRAVSTFYPGDDAGNGYPSYHPFQIIGPQSTNSHGDSALAYCPGSMQGIDPQVSYSGDEWISFSTTAWPWTSYLRYGYTEFIEVS